MAKEEEARFTVGSWAGRPNYRCTKCPYETLDSADMEAHALHAHTFEMAFQEISAASAASSPRAVATSSSEEAEK